ncbi:hypothetical protein [Streptomyces sp. NBC_01285]|uniref:hypothetical protein n=1 Tax=Streptomyces sp. NBC_01285 TaxID=2903813 RepID=UPI0022570C38|nr:hypothetical protein [Streptomyces sp. NBC_01285]MCX4768963.1 hypothetical protein [Streptomyces sp. NBC_01285]
MVTAAFTASASILIAVIAYWLNHHGEKRRAMHQAKLEWVNKQLRELYGPLLVMADVNETAWKEYKNRHLPDGSQRRRSQSLTEEEARRWKIWVITVFAPAALRARDTVVEHGDLVIEKEIPRVLLDFCSHAASLEVLIAEWNSSQEADDLLVRHPGDDFAKYARASYANLKVVQSKLLGAR